MTISEVSKKYDVSVDTLRYYEKIGLLPRISRKANGIREYQPEDCQMVEFIKYMRKAGMPVEALIRYFALMRQGDDTIELRRQMLISQRAILQKKQKEIGESLERLEYKIHLYDDKMKGNKE